MEKYSYSAEDNSLLTPPIYKFFVYPLINVLPKSIPANIITICSNSLVLISFLIAYTNYLKGTMVCLWLIPLLCFAYIVGDCSDGIQARRTGTGSALGEYLDHFLDSFVTGLLTGILMLTFRTTNTVLLFCVYQFLYIGQIGTFWERLKNGVMRFSKISTSEGTMAIAIMAALYSFPAVRAADARPLVFGFSITQLIIFTAFGAAFITGILSVIHTGKYSIRLILHILFSTGIGVVLVWHIHTSIFLHTVIVTFYNVLFLESLLAATNEKRKEGLPDFFVPAACVLFFILPAYTFIIQLCQSAYLLIRITLNAAAFFNKHKRFWYWKNPENGTERK